MPAPSTPRTTCTAGEIQVGAKLVRQGLRMSMGSSRQPRWLPVSNLHKSLPATGAITEGGEWWVWGVYDPDFDDMRIRPPKKISGKVVVACSTGSKQSWV
jgi:hypothetical protein